MNQPLCPRCHAVLHIEDEGALVFCWNCGAPQVRLSEDLVTQAEQQRNAFLGQDDLPATRAASSEPDPAAVVWKSMIRIAAVVSAFFSVVASFIVSAPLALLAPAVTLALYGVRFRQTRMTASLGTRIGLLCSLFLILGTSLLGTAELLILRFTTHRMDALDAALNAAFATEKSQALALHNPSAQSFFNLSTIPEFRAGLMLGGFAMIAMVVLLLTTAAGTFAGFVRSRTQTHTQTR